jgi:hypothetical protein
MSLRREELWEQLTETAEADTHPVLITRGDPLEKVSSARRTTLKVPRRWEWELARQQGVRRVRVWSL